MKKFTYTSCDKETLAHLNFEDALNLVGHTEHFALTKLRMLSSGKKPCIYLPAGTITNFIKPEKKLPAAI